MIAVGVGEMIKGSGYYRAATDRPNGKRLALGRRSMSNRTARLLPLHHVGVLLHQRPAGFCVYRMLARRPISVSIGMDLVTTFFRLIITLLAR